MDSVVVQHFPEVTHLTDDVRSLGVKRTVDEIDPTFCTAASTSHNGASLSNGTGRAARRSRSRSQRRPVVGVMVGSRAAFDPWAGFKKGWQHRPT